MADVQPPQQKVHQTPVKKKSPQASTDPKQCYCILCRICYLKRDAHEHMHSMLHHRELETVLGKDAFHDCRACKLNSLGLSEYAKHISTAQHKERLKNLKTKNVKPVGLFKTLSKETIKTILDRNKELKRQEKKTNKKSRKKQKQEAGQKQVRVQPGVAGKKTSASKQMMQEKSQQMQTRASKQQQELNSSGGNSAVVQNKENKMSCVHRPPDNRESPFHNPNWRPVYQSGMPGGQPFYQQHVQDQCTPSAQLLRYHPFIGNNQCDQLGVERFQTDTHFKRPYPTSAVSQGGYYNTLYNYATDLMFTSDQLPETGAVLFDQNQGEKMESSPPEGSSCSAQPPSANKPDRAAPIRDVDVNAMLKQIRRELGLREPCRADREARKQSGEVGVRTADGNVTQQTEAEQLVGTTTAKTATSAASSHKTPVKPKQPSFKETQETSRCRKKSSAAVKKGANSREGESQAVSDSSASVSQCTKKTTASEPNLRITRKVQVAHKSHSPQGEEGTANKEVLDKLFNISGAKSKINWSHMYDDMKRRKTKAKLLSGTELEEHSAVNESSARDADLPLSEGFHWDVVPDIPSVSHLSPPPPPNDVHTDTQTVTQVQVSMKIPDAAQAACSSKTVERVSVKVEPNVEDESGDLRDETDARKRKPSRMTGGGVPAAKKKKTKSNKDQNQMDQLLAVSLREDELSRSLHELDRSLIQARNALQAAYADVQRLLMLRQQFTEEVNSLRSKRIVILQGMQEGYSEASNPAETTLSSGSASAVSLPSFFSSSAFTTSTSPQPAAASPVPPISTPAPAPLALSALSIKQEGFHFVTPGQANVFSKADACQVPLNQPSTLFPSDQLQVSQVSTPLLASAKQPTGESSTPAPGSSARQQKGLKGWVKPGVSAKDSQPSESESVKETEAKQDQVGKKEPAGNKSASERVKKTSGQSDDGSESDSSVEMVNSSTLEVIDIDESECENSAETNTAVEPESVEFASASTQTSQQSEAESKFQLPVLSKDASTPPESVEDDEPSLGAFSNHDGPVHGLQVHNGLLYTCSGDNTARAYSLMTRACEAVFHGHTNKVNCLLVSSPSNMPARLYTGSSDQTIRCYSLKTKKCLEQISLPDRVLCLHIAWNILYVGLASGSVNSFDLKTLKELDVFECHGPRGVSCLATAQEGARRLLLVGSYDSTISVRDAKSGLLLRSLEGHTKTVLCMKVVNDLVFSGSSDTSVHAHNIHTGELVRIYKGHGHAVTSIVILGKVMVTACLDELVRVYELQSHDRLQVYGGHSDMVMCMAVHKSVIYTGCYDGSVQAVKLNLMKNHRCWWQGCSLIFGVPEHLLHHLVKDHTNPNLQTVKCRWKECDTFFSTQQAVRQELSDHMQRHVESDSKLQA